MSFDDLKRTFDSWSNCEISGQTEQWIKITKAKLPKDVKWVVDESKISNIVYECETQMKNGTMVDYDKLTYKYEDKHIIRLYFSDEWSYGTMSDLATDTTEQNIDMVRFKLPHQSWIFSTPLTLRESPLPEILEKIDPKWHFGMYLLQYQFTIGWTKRSQRYCVVQ